ncbi:ferrochelatase [Bdellovibrio sp. 22V]|uniref:ferrochelatase n=1 Tax=Bdellovibrio sp. 22V TaxID=3044166 RepID=UPI002543B145|nr:ferrochelatase [Bdellovibrio sp. 22V]WII72439.1 ferrochelatase [Bdellovibrio sp. 22V]
MGKTGILLLNIGSPLSYEVSDVAKYLKTFLMDKDIISIPYLLRWPLVNAMIVPKRAPYSAANYKKIWIDNEGSPLTVYTRRFADKLQKQLGEQFLVKIGMRYSEPSIEKALREFATAAVDTILLAPLYPQFAQATTGSSVRETQKIAARLGLNTPLRTLAPFYHAPAFITPSVQIIRDALEGKEVDHYLFSFHGLPESQIRKVHGCLRSDDCCFVPNACEKGCYRAQCFATATRIAESLEIPASHWSVSFQSRLGRGEWLKPATDHTLEILAQTGKKKIAVVCPSFVADCIETLEEIGIGGKELFIEKGGDEYHLVPCLNDDERWVQGFADLLKEKAPSKVELEERS